MDVIIIKIRKFIDSTMVGTITSEFLCAFFNSWQFYKFFMHSKTFLAITNKFSTLFRISVGFHFNVLHLNFDTFQPYITCKLVQTRKFHLTEWRRMKKNTFWMKKFIFHVLMKFWVSTRNCQQFEDDFFIQKVSSVSQIHLSYFSSGLGQNIKSFLQSWVI